MHSNCVHVILTDIEFGNNSVAFFHNVLAQGPLASQIKPCLTAKLAVL